MNLKDIYVISADYEGAYAKTKSKKVVAFYEKHLACEVVTAEHFLANLVEYTEDDLKWLDPQ